MGECFSFWYLTFSMRILNKKCSQRLCRSHNLQFIVKTEHVHPIPCSPAHSCSYTGTCLNSQENFGMAVDVKHKKGIGANPPRTQSPAALQEKMNYYSVTGAALLLFCFLRSVPAISAHLQAECFPKPSLGMFPSQPAYITQAAKVKISLVSLSSSKVFSVTEKCCTSGNVVK